MAETGVRPVQQDRSAKTRDKILAVLERALAGGTLDQMTVQDIVQAAGCSVGAFYGRFEDKNAAIAALYRQRREDFLDRLRRISEDAADLDDWARRAASAALDHATANRSLLANAASAAPDGAVATMYAEARVANLDMVDTIRAMLTGRFGLKFSGGEGAGAPAFALAMIGAMTRDAAVFSAGLLGPEKNRQWFVEQLARAIAAYLRSF